MNRVYSNKTLCVGGAEISVKYRYDATKAYFTNFEKIGFDENDRAGDPGSPALLPVASISDEDWDYYLSLGMMDTPHTEYNMLTAHIGDCMLDNSRMIVHSVALNYCGQAWLICARSGVGKSTQARLLQELCPGDFSVICGDRPILEFHEDLILVHPSPWNGKEGWQGGEAAPLKGMILLKRGDKDEISEIVPRRAIDAFYPQIIQTAKEEARIHKSAELATTLLSTISLWSMTSCNLPDSTKLLLRTVFHKDIR